VFKQELYDKRTHLLVSAEESQRLSSTLESGGKSDRHTKPH